MAAILVWPPQVEFRTVSGYQHEWTNIIWNLLIWIANEITPRCRHEVSSSTVSNYLKSMRSYVFADKQEDISFTTCNCPLTLYTRRVRCYMLKRFWNLIDLIKNISATKLAHWIQNTLSSSRFQVSVLSLSRQHSIISNCRSALITENNFTWFRCLSGKFYLCKMLSWVASFIYNIHKI